jgi:phospholipid/cholesterol/gamma-HCH transport system ATP-binding protein
MDDPWVEVNDLTFTRQGRKIFNAINLKVQPGKITAIMGPSGTGKTTLLQLIGGMLRPDSGQVLVNQQNIHDLSNKTLAKARRNMGLLFQNGALFTDLSVFENVAFPLREHTNLDAHLLKQVVLMKLEAVGLRGTADLMPSQLSGGMARRVALARAMALDPDLMLFDEPFTGQDPIAMGVLVRLIQQLNQLLNMTTVIVSHDVEETAAIADYIYLIAEGRVIGEGAPEALQASSEPRVRQFMLGQADGFVPFHYPAKPYEEELMDA